MSDDPDMKLGQDCFIVRDNGQGAAFEPAPWATSAG